MTISVITLEGTPAHVQDADIESLRRTVRGDVVVFGQLGYEAAREPSRPR